MAQPEPTPQPDDMPLIVAPGDVDQLLETAEALAGEIAAAIGLPGRTIPEAAKPPAQGPANEQASQLVEPTPSLVQPTLSALQGEEVEFGNLRFDDGAADVPDAATAESPVPFTAQATQLAADPDVLAPGTLPLEPPDRDQACDENQTAVVSSPANSAQSNQQAVDVLKSESDSLVDRVRHDQASPEGVGDTTALPAESVAPSATTSPLNASPPAATNQLAPGAGHSKSAGARGQIDEAPSPTEGAPGSTAEVPNPDEADGEVRKPSRLARMLKGATRAALATAMAPLNLLLALIWLIDRPFARTPAKARSYVGAIAMATVIAGILSFVLPGMLAVDPFADEGAAAEISAD